MPALDGQSVGDFGHRNPGGTRQNFFQCAMVLGIEMLQKDESHPGGIRQIRQQGGEGFETTGGRTDTHYGKEFVQRGTRSGGSRRRRDRRTALALAS